MLSGRIRPEIIGKNPGNSRPEYCFHVPGFSRLFLQDTVAGTIDLGNTRLSVAESESLDAIKMFADHIKTVYNRHDPFRSQDSVDPATEH